MSRMHWNLVLAAVVASGVVGCAQCDTCDDFPAPCTGPNCGHNHAPMPLGAPVMTGPMAPEFGSVPVAPMGGDDAGPAPSVPAATPPDASLPM